MPDDKDAREEQRRAFIQRARELGCDENSDAFERALDRILPARRPGEPARQRQERPAPKGSRRKPKGDA